MGIHIHSDLSVFMEETCKSKKIQKAPPINCAEIGHVIHESEVCNMKTDMVDNNSQQISANADSSSHRSQQKKKTIYVFKGVLEV